MSANVVVIGAGIIGASAAYHLQKAGARVTVVDAGARSATQASFGWINASFYLDEDHFHLRAAGIKAYRTLCDELALPIRWEGCLCYENQGLALEAQRDALRALGYDCTEIDTDTFAELAPAIADPPERCLLFQQEAAASSGGLARQLLLAATQLGARVMQGVRVIEIMSTSGRISGLRSDAGVIGADMIVCAAGTATENLLATAGLRLPLLTRPAVMVKTRPVPPVLNHIVVSGLGELRQLPCGALLIPAAIGHQSDRSESLTQSVTQTADATIARLKEMLPGLDLHWAEATLAYRPVPADERPVIGLAADGLYVACMHSGITLGAVAGGHIATEVLNGPTNDTAAQLAPYRPVRFAQ